MLFKKISPAVCAAAVCAALTVFSAPGGAQEVEVGDVMNRMEKAYIEVVSSLLLFPVQESGNEAPFDKIQKQLDEIAGIARDLPQIENYKNDNSFRVAAENLEKEARAFSALAGKKQQGPSVTALFRLQAACLKCHENFRF